MRYGNKTIFKLFVFVFSTHVNNLSHQALLVQEGVTSSKKNHTGRLELSPLVLNDSLQQSENKFNTQKPNREMQTPCLLPGKRDVPLQQCFGCEESGVSFSSW